MITVRFATGVAVQYNDANFAHRGDTWTDLRDKKDGRLIAQVPTGAAVIEFQQQPCRVYHGVTSAEIADDFLKTLDDDRQRRQMSTYTLAAIKRKLGAFNATRRTWK